MIGELIGDWIKGILIDGIMGNLSGLFSTVNTKVGEIASDVWQIVQCCFIQPKERPYPNDERIS